MMTYIFIYFKILIKIVILCAYMHLFIRDGGKKSWHTFFRHHWAWEALSRIIKWESKLPRLNKIEWSSQIGATKDSPQWAKHVQQILFQNTSKAQANSEITDKELWSLLPEFEQKECAIRYNYLFQQLIISEFNFRHFNSNKIACTRWFYIDLYRPNSDQGKFYQHNIVCVWEGHLSARGNPIEMPIFQTRYWSSNKEWAIVVQNVHSSIN